jgi:hypothetical protein
LQKNIPLETKGQNLASADNFEGRREPLPFPPCREAASWEPRSPPTRAGLGGESTMAALLPAGGLFSGSAAEAPNRPGSARQRSQCPGFPGQKPGQTKSRA